MFFFSDFMSQCFRSKKIKFPNQNIQKQFQKQQTHVWNEWWTQIKLWATFSHHQRELRDVRMDRMDTLTQHRPCRGFGWWKESYLWSSHLKSRNLSRLNSILKRGIEYPKNLCEFLYHCTCAPHNLPSYPLLWGMGSG